MNIEIYKTEWDQNISNSVKEENYSNVINFYENKINSEIHEISDYFYLGLAYLLDGQEDLAQMTWFSAIAEGECLEADAYIILEFILNQEANRLIESQDIEAGWLVRQYIREINPNNLENIFDLIILSINTGKISEEFIDEWNVIDLIKSDKILLEDEEYFKYIEDILKFRNHKILNIIDEISKKVKNKSKFANILYQIINKIRDADPEFAGKVSKISTRLFPDNVGILHTVAWCYAATTNYQEAIQSALELYNKCQSRIWKIMAIYLLIREKTRGGEWEGIDIIYSEYKLLMNQLEENNLSEDNVSLKFGLAIIPCMLQYYQDNLIENRYFHNKLSKIFQSNIVNTFLLNPDDPKSDYSKFSYLLKRKNVNINRKIKVGFLISKISLHSVGWLIRWIFLYYNREKFDFYVYAIKQVSGDKFTRNWFESNVEECRFLGNEDFKNINKIIYEDDIDILIDLDSTTSSESCFILSLKPAPIQATWLGFDASGIPAIDYFIVDSYLLPEGAEQYYREKLWRLPNTYLAVDGFEVEVPTISHESLNIPKNAVIYLSSQTGQKRNPETVKLQLQILKEVPNGYLIIKGWGEMSIIEDLFSKISQEVGVDTERLRFLPLARNEFIHRANLQIADVILDTYPYNGATTTLEALWVGIPIVTRVGSQCAARNSYTFLANVGIEDGIATTDEEYVAWGIRFGTDPQLRQKVSTQIQLSKQSSCIWDTKTFVREMEHAFEKMWEIYSQTSD